MTSIAAPPALDIRGVSKRFPGAKGAETVAIDDVSLHVGRGELVCLVGASGSGKSTLLSIVAGLTEPTSGEALLEGLPVAGPSPDRGLVFQGYSLFPWRTVAENVAFGLEIAGMPKRERDARVAELLEVMGLSKWASSRPSQLSGGMRQRVAIARSLAPRPEVLLLDEPFGALDAHTRTLMQEFLLQLWRETGLTILMVTHDVEEALYLAQRIYVLSSHPGRVKRELTMPFGADRPFEVRRTPEFLDLRDELQQMLRREVSDM
ncbi:MAG: ABC transporter ATP-binding protein [Dehalococcoidia bacterium]